MCKGPEIEELEEEEGPGLFGWHSQIGAARGGDISAAGFCLYQMSKGHHERFKIRDGPVRFPFCKGFLVDVKRTDPMSWVYIAI